MAQWDPTTAKMIQFCLTPKAHWLLHYPDVVRKLGNLFALSTMRYENKHSFFKNYARKISNQTQLLKYLAIKHQEWWALAWAQSNDMIQIDSSKEYEIDEEDQVPLAEGCEWKKLSFINYKYYIYPGSYVSQETTLGLVEFFIVKNIYMSRDENQSINYFLQVTPVTTVFNNFYNSYELTDTCTETIFIDLETMDNCESFELWKSKKLYAKNFIFCKKNCIFLRERI